MDPLQALPNDPPETLIEVGDVVAGRFARGEGRISAISVCLRPYVDPGAELYAVKVDAVEAHGVTFTVSFEDGGWAYGIEIERITVKGGDEK